MRLLLCISRAELRKWKRRSSSMQCFFVTVNHTPCDGRYCRSFHSNNQVYIVICNVPATCRYGTSQKRRLLCTQQVVKKEIGILDTRGVRN